MTLEASISSTGISLVTPYLKLVLYMKDESVIVGISNDHSFPGIVCVI
jgi:hypothetical protein